MSSRSHQITAIGWLLTSFGHTMTARDWQNQKDFRSISNLPKSCGTIGWYQGSGLFLILALLNYQYSLNPAALRTEVDKAVIGTAVATVWASALYYYKKGILGNAVVTSVVGGLQTWSFFFA